MWRDRRKLGRVPSSLVSCAAARDSGPSGARAVAKETTPSPDQACFIFASLISRSSYHMRAGYRLSARHVLSFQSALLQHHWLGGFDRTTVSAGPRVSRLPCRRFQRNRMRILFTVQLHLIKLILKISTDRKTQNRLFEGVENLSLGVELNFRMEPEQLYSQMLTESVRFIKSKKHKLFT